MKKLVCLLLALCLLFALSLSVSARESEYARMEDFADIFSEEVEENVQRVLDILSEEWQTDLSILTLDGIGMESIGEFSESFYDQTGCGMGKDADGILLVIDMESRQLWITTTGYGMALLNGWRLESLLDDLQAAMKSGHYDSVPITFVNTVERYLEEDGFTPAAYAEGRLGRQLPTILLVSLLIGVVIAFFVLSSMKRKHKSVAFQHGAAGYVVAGSFALTKSRDLFLYRRISRTPRPKSSSSSGSSGGRSHGGGGRSF